MMAAMLPHVARADLVPGDLVFFYSPSELAEKSVRPNQRVRIGGLPARVLLGDPGWYAHFGFETAADHGIGSPGRKEDRVKTKFRPSTSVNPQLPPEVLLTTCAWALVLPASVVGL